MSSTFVCVSFPASITELEWKSYLHGLSEIETASLVCKDLSLDIDAFPFITREVTDNYCVLSHIEAALVDPRNLITGGEPTIALPLSTIRTFITIYYEPTDTIVRLLLGKFLSSRVRSQLDVLAERAGVRAKEAIRTFDCLRRVFDRCIDIEWQAPLCTFIASKYQIPNLLAWRYVCIFFLFKSRFDITNDKRLKYIPMASLEQISSSIICACAPIIVSNDAPETYTNVLEIRTEIKKIIDSLDTKVLNQEIKSSRPILSLDTSLFVLPLRDLSSRSRKGKGEISEGLAQIILNKCIENGYDDLVNILQRDTFLDDLLVTIRTLVGIDDDAWSDFLTKIATYIICPLKELGCSLKQADILLNILQSSLEILAMSNASSKPDFIHVVAWKRLLYVVRKIVKEIWEYVRSDSSY